MRKKLNLILAIFILTSVLVLVFPVQHKQDKENFSLNEIRYIDEIINLVDYNNSTESIDRIRSFVYDNSIYLVDEEFYTYYQNIPYILSRLIDTYKNNAPPPHLACGSRAMVMKSILDYVKVESRLIHIYSDNYDEVRGHTFLEVLNPETLNWGVQDPDLNIYYIDCETNRRATVLQLVFGDISKIIPISPSLHGWNNITSWMGWSNLVPLRDNYFECILYQWLNGTIVVKSVMLINTDRFNITKRFPQNNNMTILEVVKKQCNDPTIILNPGWSN